MEGGEINNGDGNELREGKEKDRNFGKEGKRRNLGI